MKKILQSLLVTGGVLICVFSLFFATIDTNAKKAFAIDSPEYSAIESETASSNNVSLFLKALVLKYDQEMWQLKCTSSSSIASEAQNLPSNMLVLASFSVYPESKKEGISSEELWNRVELYQYNMTFLFGSDADRYEGKTAHIYFDHHDGSTEVTTEFISNGSTNITASLSTITVAVDMDSGQNGINCNPVKNTSSISPQTGEIGANQTIAVQGLFSLIAFSSGFFFLFCRKKFC